MTCNRSVAFSSSSGFLRQDIAEMLLKLALSTMISSSTNLFCGHILSSFILQLAKNIMYFTYMKHKLKMQDLSDYDSCLSGFFFGGGQIFKDS
jgi:hypothetical protein